MPDNTRCPAQQFGAHSTRRVANLPDALGSSLPWLVDLLDPQPAWRVLDASSGGNTALAVAQRFERVIAINLTRLILQAVRSEIEQQGVTHVACCQSDAGHLPFASDQYDAVVCHMSTHHFPDVAAFVRESARVLKPGGSLALADNMVSGEAKIAQFFNTVEKLRDPSHHWTYSLEDWQTFLFTAGLTVTHSELFPKELDFDDWAGRAGVAGNDLTRLRVLVRQAPDAPREWLNPRQIGSRLLFTLTEGIVIGRKP